ncbi:serine/threonine protein phosphatase [Aliifodinibius sp. S!AR15-10]|uniref:metallophosphoesterase family protein n=1 Tax=Aliifodinibius sp. S!AR15-10 TaxID=2950437 RepID=UPI002865EB3A|nr:metallophosphoesterase family protein [Aliifodinibius sp. S!AR15-10]MDR8392384.1 serine/threonine protein phosphatase [Aliifodinibius sp. S!AR15-10]
MAENKFIVIGDIHGCLESLNALLGKLAKYDDRTIVFIGDYIDRGPDSKGVVDLLLEYRQDHDCIFLRGNHEQMLLDAIRKDGVNLWLTNGGRSTLRSYGTNDRELDLPEEHIKFYYNTQIYYDTPDYFFVHAGLAPHKTIEESIANKKEHVEFLWERSHLNAFETSWEKKVVFGHTPRPHPLQKEKMLGIDTGCVYQSLGYGKLTAALLPEEKFIQQICLDN